MREARMTGAVVAAGAVFALSAAAFAQTAAPAPPAPAAAGGGGLFSSNGPIDVSADGAEQFQSEGRTVYVGNVEVIQGQARMRTPRLTIFSAKRPKGAAPGPAAGPGTGLGDLGAVERVEAEGPVYYVTPTQQVKGDHGTYLASSDTITVTGNVTLLQGQDVLHGDKLVTEQKSGHSVLTTDKPGKGAQRVRGVFFPKDAQKPGAAPAAAPPATKPGG